MNERYLQVLLQMLLIFTIVNGANVCFCACHMSVHTTDINQTLTLLISTLLYQCQCDGTGTIKNDNKCITHFSTKFLKGNVQRFSLVNPSVAN